MAVMNNVFLHLHPVRVRQHAVKFAYTFCLGGLSFFFFLVLTVTGVYLMFFYVPSATQAYSDILRIQAEVPFGLLTRNIHRWAAHLMVFFVFLHMMRVFYHGAYKPPREFNWVVGVVLLLPDRLPVLHRLPAALGPDRLLGHHHRHQHGQLRAALQQAVAAAAASVASRWARTPCCASTSCTSSSCRSWRPSSWPCTSGASARTEASAARSRPCHDDERRRDPRSRPQVPAAGTPRRRRPSRSGARTPAGRAARAARHRDRQAARAHGRQALPPAGARQAGRRRAGPEGAGRHGHDLAAPAVASSSSRRP